MTVHIDVGLTGQMARILGEQPSIIILCGAADGEFFGWDSIVIRAIGWTPAACDCGVCKAIADIMYREDKSPENARRIYRQRREAT